MGAARSPLDAIESAGPAPRIPPCETGARACGRRVTRGLKGTTAATPSLHEVVGAGPGPGHAAHAMGAARSPLDAMESAGFVALRFAAALCLAAALSLAAALLMNRSSCLALALAVSLASHASRCSRLRSACWSFTLAAATKALSAAPCTSLW